MSGCSSRNTNGASLLYPFDSMIFPCTVIFVLLGRAIATPPTPAPHPPADDSALGIKTVTLERSRPPLHMSLQISGYTRDSLFSGLDEPNAEWEPHLMMLFGLFVRRTNVVVDAGANIGLHTLSLSRLVTLGRVYAYEASPENYAMLSRNVKQNHASNVVLAGRPTALTEGHQSNVCIQSSASLQPPSKKLANGALNMMNFHVEHKPAAKPCPLSSFSVNGLALDQVGLTRVDVIKVDIQGSEGSFLRGAEATINSSLPIIVIEFEEHSLRQFSSSTRKLVKYLQTALREPYHIFLLAYSYPSDHVAVPVSKVARFRSLVGAHRIFPLTARNSVNKNVQSGVREQICPDLAGGDHAHWLAAYKFNTSCDPHPHFKPTPLKTVSPISQRKTAWQKMDRGHAFELRAGNLERTNAENVCRAIIWSCMPLCLN